MNSVFITGANRGIGLGLAKHFSQKGWQVWATYRNKENSAELFQLASENPDKINLLSLAMQDVLDPSFDLKGWEHRPLDVLINNAGILGHCPLEELSYEKLISVYKINSAAPLLLSKYLIPSLEMGQHKTIANMTSHGGSIGSDNAWGDYGYRSSKAALNMLMNCLFKDLQKKNSKSYSILQIHPGWVQTDMGGAAATATVAESAKGVYQLIEKYQGQGYFGFMDYQDKKLPW